MRDRWRRFLSQAIVVLCGAAVLIALVPLILILFYVVSKGASSLSLAFFTEMPKPVGEAGGGMANAIVGSLMVVGLGAVMLGFGRALGETMAVTMVIGNNPQVSASLFAPQYTMAAVIANEFTEAADQLYLAALVEIGLVLFIITLIVNSLSRLLIWTMARPGRRSAATIVVPAEESAA